MTTQNNPLTHQQEMLRRRLPVVVVLLIIMSGVLLLQLASFQLWLSPEVSREFELRSQSSAGSIRRVPAERGIIYDRGGQPLAFNTFQYGIGISPNLVVDAEEISAQLALILNRDQFELYNIATSSQLWVQIARPVSAEVGQAVDELDISAITIEPIPHRFYPQGALAAQVIGFVIEDNNNTRGAMGVESKYNDQLAGRTLDQTVSNVPFDLPPEEPEGGRGKDVILSIDRDIQFWIESELLLAINETGATSGTIIVMDPRNGDILAMASYPSFDPNNFIDVVDERILTNPAISETYEPGSVMKVLTVASALDAGIITPDWTYNDQSVLEVGGVSIQNWDRKAHGVVDVTNLLVQSLNVGAATVSLEMGPDLFYSAMGKFGIGRLTNVDLPGEESGILKVPGDPDWSESDLGTNSFGQGVSVTSLQMITAFAAIANDGLMMQPRIVIQTVDGEKVINARPSPLGRPISAETAMIVRDMMVRVIEDNVTAAALSGYSIAGKTGTAEIPSPVGYESDSSIVTFIGFLPADDPEVVVLVKLDRPDGYWGSVVAAPIFRRIADRLVILLEIPTDDVRNALLAQGGP